MSLRLGIDASNLRSGGAVTHLLELLRVADPEAAGLSTITVWGEAALLDKLPQRRWLNCERVEILSSSLPARILWQTTQLDRAARAHCDMLLVPGGVYLGAFRPFITMSRNMLPFDKPAARLYAEERMRVRLALLRKAQAATFRRADGVVFLTRTAQQVVTRAVGKLRARQTVIPHGVNAAFRREPRVQRPIESYTSDNPFEWLYVSIIDVYKHQDAVAEAVALLRARGLPVTVRFVGPAYPPSLERLRAVMSRLDPAGQFIRYNGATPHAKLVDHYHRADGYVFASSCENLPNTLLEGMAAGLPIAAARASVIPEVLSDAGIYFNSANPEEIASALEQLTTSAGSRADYAQRAYTRALQFDWSLTANATLRFAASCARPVAV
jgi:glycosyltransferase involved in cell wall biosynthesis